MRRPFVAIPLAAALLLSAGACTSYVVKDKITFVDMNYAEPAPGHFKVVKRGITATAFWDSKESKEKAGSARYMERMTSLMIEATKALLANADLQPNQALYNVRVSAPRVTDQYFGFFIWFHSRYAVTITADVIEFI
jgi:hypothetical protein